MIKGLDVATGKQSLSMAGPSGAVFSLSLSRDGRTLATGSFDFLVRIWDVPSLRNIAVVRAPAKGIAFSRGMELDCQLSPDGRTLATVDLRDRMSSEIKFGRPILRVRTPLISPEVLQSTLSHSVPKEYFGGGERGEGN